MTTSYIVTLDQRPFGPAPHQPIHNCCLKCPLIVIEKAQTSSQRPCVICWLFLARPPVWEPLDQINVKTNEQRTVNDVKQKKLPTTKMFNFNLRPPHVMFGWVVSMLLLMVQAASRLTRWWKQYLHPNTCLV